MPEESLRELLARLHERLSASTSIDAESRKLLGTLTRDIERALASGEGTVERADKLAAAEHTPRLEAFAVQFEAEHPAVAETLREVIDALGKAGI
ncbi:MAG TPA: DUF4404 family protein [Steroidobacteraceae bacterium]|nr:DUF4404 family protein [Steroidobacteraceae bacterium]